MAKKESPHIYIFFFIGEIKSGLHTGERRGAFGAVHEWQGMHCHSSNLQIKRLTAVTLGLKLTCLKVNCSAFLPLNVPMGRGATAHGTYGSRLAESDGMTVCFNKQPMQAHICGFLLRLCPCFPPYPSCQSKTAGLCCYQMGTHNLFLYLLYLKGPGWDIT